MDGPASWEAVPELAARNGVDIMQVCENGHWITSLYLASPNKRKQRCDSCGAQTLIACRHCHDEIPGIDHSSPVGAGVGVPSHCANCGERFPWADQIEAARNTTAAHSTLERIERLCSRFQAVARQLQMRHGDRDAIDVSDEYHVADLLHALLQIDFDDIRPMDWTPSYAGGSSRMGFLLKTEQILVEVKKTRPTLTAKELGEQLTVDIARYEAHPDCKVLACFVYDPGRHMDNPAGIQSALEKKSTDTLMVKLFIYPK